MKLQPRALFFDLDGTLLESAPDLLLAVEAAMRAIDHPVPDLERLRHWVGNGTEKLVQRAITGSMEGEVDPALMQRAMPVFNQAYAEALGKASHPFPGVLDTLRALQRTGLPMACITNKPQDFTVPLLRDQGLLDFFTVVVGGDVLPEKKPHPAPLLHAASHCGQPIEQCLMVGDSQHDVQAARNAGCPVVAVSYGYNHGDDIRDAGPDAVIDRFEQLRSLLEVDA